MKGIKKMIGERERVSAPHQVLVSFKTAMKAAMFDGSFYFQP